MNQNSGPGSSNQVPPTAQPQTSNTSGSQLSDNSTSISALNSDAADHDLSKPQTGNTSDGQLTDLSSYAPAASNEGVSEERPDPRSSNSITGQSQVVSVPAPPTSAPIGDTLADGPLPQAANTSDDRKRPSQDGRESGGRSQGSGGAAGSPPAQASANGDDGVGVRFMLDPIQMGSIVDAVTENMLRVTTPRTPSGVPSGPTLGQPGAIDPALAENPIRDQYKKNIEAHRNKRWYAFWGISVISAAFFFILGFFIFRVLSVNFLPAVIGAAGSTWQWHVLIFLGVVLTLTAAVPLSLAMALVKMISDKEKDGSEGGDLKAPGIELAKAIIDLCKSVTAAITK